MLHYDANHLDLRKCIDTDRTILILKFEYNQTLFVMVEFSYKNTTSSMVVIKCIGRNTFFLERAIFPYEIYTLIAPKDAHVEIWGLHSFGPQLEQRLRLSDSSDLLAA